jgi:hypothetical protein
MHINQWLQVIKLVGVLFAKRSQVSASGVQASWRAEFDCMSIGKNSSDVIPLPLILKQSGID